MLPSGPRATQLRHVRAPVPLRFPEFAEMPEGSAHLILRTFLYRLLRHALGSAHSVGSDQFVYWVPTEPRTCAAPDLFVKLDVPQLAFPIWQCWRHGAPDLAVEIVSPNEGDSVDWEDTLARYADMGVIELLRFDPEQTPGSRMRAWDRIDGDFVERVVEGDTTPCVTLGEPSLHWVVCPVDIVPVGLRLAEESGALVLSEVEAEAKARKKEADARLSAEARVRELEEELARRGSHG